MTTSREAQMRQTERWDLISTLAFFGVVGVCIWKIFSPHAFSTGIVVLVAFASVVLNLYGWSSVRPDMDEILRGESVDSGGRYVLMACVSAAIMCVVGAVWAIAALLE